jgi:hypothetical protein
MARENARIGTLNSLLHAVQTRSAAALKPFSIARKLRLGLFVRR